MNETNTPLSPPPADQGLDILALIAVLLSRFKMILGFVLLFAVIGGGYLSLQTPLYTATSLVRLNVKELPLMDRQALVIGQVEDKAAIQSELDILRSPELAIRVISRLKLYEKAEFNPAVAGLSQSKLAKLKRAIKKRLGRDKDAQEKDPARAQEINRLKILRAVQGKVVFNKDPLSYTVRIEFISIIPDRAKHIANAFAEEYLRYQIEMREQSSREANQWLAKRVDELRRDVIKSERAVQEFSEDNNLFELNGMTLNNRQLSDLNARLADERARIAQSTARLEQAQKLLSTSQSIEAVPEVLNSTLIQKLLEQEATLLREKSEIAQHFGPKHPTMERVTQELNDLRTKIAFETRKIVEGLENELAVATAQAKSVEAELASLRAKLGESTKQSIDLAELGREAEVNRSLYEAFLTRLKETGEAISLEQSNAKIIARAQLPLSPSKPKKPLIMALFIMMGGFLGGFLALLLEYYSRGFSSPEHIETALGLEHLGMVPESTQNGAESGTSVEAEALRSILARLQFAGKTTPEGEQRPPRSLLIMSSLPQEGKGWLATSLARIAAGSGKRVLLIDCDLHRRSIAESFKSQTSTTDDTPLLNDYLKGNAELRDIIVADGASGMDYIASEPMQDNIQKMLESEAMAQIMDYAHEYYDIVFVDAPPVIGLSDVFFLSRLVDSAVFVVRHGHTPRRIAQNALRNLSRARMKIAGAVLTRVDLDAYKKMEFGGNKGYSAYAPYYEDDAQPRSGKILPFTAQR